MRIKWDWIFKIDVIRNILMKMMKFRLIYVGFMDSLKADLLDFWAE
jgi:hypothetical protein